jgi:energy-coupling factor transporter ATP-binding protein EcfA2
VPRLGNERVPLVVALIGSTGAGKSTLVNSLARRLISKAGVLRPTTNRSMVWTNASYRDGLDGLGEIVEDDHPLLDAIALVDTPDLDSNVAGHYQEAMAVAESSDAVVFVTTAARYGDAIPWAVLSELSQRLPVAIVLNRVPTRSAGARNDLLARLRRIRLGEVPVLSISEQRVDPERGLSRPSIQRFAHLMKVWAFNASEHRRRSFEFACELVSGDVRQLLAAIEERQHREAALAKAMGARYRMALTEVEDRLPIAPTKRSRTSRGRDRTSIDMFRRTALGAVDAAAHDVGQLWASSGVTVPADYLRASAGTASVIRLMIPVVESAAKLREAFAVDAARFLGLLARDTQEIVTRLETGIANLVGLELTTEPEPDEPVLGTR